MTQRFLKESVLIAAAILVLGCGNDGGAADGQECGDGQCQPGEANSCPADCQAPDSCGDGQCLSGESPDNCPQDCGQCGFFCGANNDVHYCDEDGRDASFECPSALGSECDDSLMGAVCSCGGIGEGGECFSDPGFGTDLVRCEFGELAFYQCSPGSFCGDGGGEAQCFCDNTADGVCPDAVCVDDPDCSNCTPDCTADDGNTNDCGSNGCGGVCGSCQPTEICRLESATGWNHCVDQCTPDCDAKSCGPDGCGGSCGPSCPSGETCEAGTCSGGGGVGNSISYTVAGAVTRSVSSAGAVAPFFLCRMNEATNRIDIVSGVGDSSLDIIIENDPIGFCFFATSSFTEFRFTNSTGPGDFDFDVYKIDPGVTESVVLSCDVVNGRFTATFSTGNLYKSGSAEVFPDDLVTIANGTIACDLE